MRLEYVGPLDGVEVPTLGVAARRGEVVEVPDDAGRRLCEQSCWRESKPEPKPKPVKEDN